MSILQSQGYSSMHLPTTSYSSSMPMPIAGYSSMSMPTSNGSIEITDSTEKSLGLILQMQEKINNRLKIVQDEMQYSRYFLHRTFETLENVHKLLQNSFIDISLAQLPPERPSFPDIDSLTSHRYLSDLEVGATSASSSSASTSSMSSSLSSIPSTNQYQSRDLESHPSFATDSSSESSLFSLATPSLNTPFSDVPLDLPIFNTETVPETSVLDSTSLSASRSHPQESSENTHICPECEKGFPSSRSLTNHTSKQHRNKRFACPVQPCGKKFSDRGHLKRHIRVHTGDRPFKCPTCERLFADKTNMNRHKETHSSNKKFECLGCHKKFIRKTSFIKHLGKNTFCLTQTNSARIGS